MRSRQRQAIHSLVTFDLFRRAVTTAGTPAEPERGDSARHLAVQSPHAVRHTDASPLAMANGPADERVSTTEPGNAHMLVVGARWKPERMAAAMMMHRLAEVIGAHDWNALPGLLHDDFTCHYVHTGEVFDRASWVQLNADYPGFDRLVLQDCIGTDARAAGRSHVTGHADEKLQHFEVATFITLRAGRIAEMTEVWADTNAEAPHGTRPA